jgi:hypothetical protein
MYAIMRCKKLSSMGTVAAALRHCYRERDTPNADPQLTPQNEHLAASNTDQAMGRLREMLPERRRKDAVLTVEYVMTASPDWWKQASPEQQAEFFARSKKWLADKYGADRIITASIHRDEKSPHLSAFVIPLTQDRRLSAKEFIGDRKKMSQDQSTFAAAVADLGLHRGIEGSKARHTRLKAFYSAIEKPEQHIEITPEALEPRRYKPRGLAERLGLNRRFETQETVAKRVTKLVQEGYAKAVEMASIARQEREKAKRAEETAKDLRDRLKPVVDALQPLDAQHRRFFADLMRLAGEKLLSDQREKTQKKEREQEPKRDRGHSR